MKVPFSPFWDTHATRYHLVKSKAGAPYNWLFLPGGPGADSHYFLSLIQCFEMPGNYWLMDLPANGDNLGHENKLNPDYDFDLWLEYFLPSISNFQNLILVGHSFGGMLPLLYPELENILKGFVILNSAPSLWLAAAAEKAQQKGIAILTAPITEFEQHPSPETFKRGLDACMPYYFPPASMEKGKALFESLPFNYHAAAWWLRKANEMNFKAKWVPQHVPTLIIGGTEDCIVPFTLFENDTRFHRENITLTLIQDAGHAPWIEKPEIVKAAFDGLVGELTGTIACRV